MEAPGVQKRPSLLFCWNMCALESEYAGSNNQQMPQELSLTLLLLLSVQLYWGNTKFLLFSFLTFLHTPAIYRLCYKGNPVIWSVRGFVGIVGL